MVYSPIPFSEFTIPYHSRCCIFDQLERLNRFSDANFKRFGSKDLSRNNFPMSFPRRRESSAFLGVPACAGMTIKDLVSGQIQSMPQPGQSVKTAIFSAKEFDHEYLQTAAERAGLELVFFESGLGPQTTSLADGFDVVSIFCNDHLAAATVQVLAAQGVRLIALRGAGFNNVDLDACGRHGIRVVRVPEYSPHAVAEHTFGLILTLNRKIHKAFNRVREGNFALSGLMGFDLYGKTIGIIGAGRIGGCVAGIAHGFGMQVLLFDPNPSSKLELFGRYSSLDEILRTSDVVTLHCPLNEHTRHLINADALEKMKRGAMLVNTGRGALIDTAALIQGLKDGQVGQLAIDVYEEEANMFFEDRSSSMLMDDTFARLLTFNNVLVTGHQAFFTHEALTQIAETTISSILAWRQGERLTNEVLSPLAAASQAS